MMMIFTITSKWAGDPAKRVSLWHDWAKKVIVFKKWIRPLWLIGGVAANYGKNTVSQKIRLGPIAAGNRTCVHNINSNKAQSHWFMTWH